MGSRTPRHADWPDLLVDLPMNLEPAAHPPRNLRADLRTAFFEGAVLLAIVAFIEVVVFPLIG